MNKRSSVKKCAFLCVVCAALLTVVMAVKTKTEAKAFELFGDGKVSVKKCAISLSQDTFDWTGEDIRPEVRVNYQGTDLELNVDYVVTYEDNNDAGEAKVKIEGKGNYKGKKTLKFKINGIDFAAECKAVIQKGKVDVYYMGNLLKDKKDYECMVIRSSEVVQSNKVQNGYLNEYRIYDSYTIVGKGQFEGTITKTIVSTDYRYEKNKPY